MGRDLVGPAMLYVIVTYMHIGWYFLELTPLPRRQMCGRAGRKGKDDAGETYLICGKSDLEAVCDLLEADMPAIASCLAPEKRGLKRYFFFFGILILPCFGDIRLLICSEPFWKR